MNKNVLTREVVFLTNEKIMGIGTRIKEARKAKGIASKDFASCLGIGKDQLSRIENGKTVCKLDYLYIITQYLDVSLEYLVYGENEDVTIKEVNELLKGKKLVDLRRALKVLKALFE